MKKRLLALALVLASVSMTTTTHANWFGGGNGGEWKQGPNGMYWDESNWPEWTPMYWMEEFMDEFDNNGWGGGNNWGGNNWGNNNGGYGMPYGGYNMAPYGYNAPPYGYGMPYGGYGYTYPQVPTPPVIPAPIPAQ